MTTLEGFFSPASVAIVGASEKSGWTRMVLDGVDASSSTPDVYLVNPRTPSVHGRRTTAALEALPAPVDLAFLQVAPERVVGAVEECLAAGTRDLVVLSAGLGEAGDEGKAVEARLRAMCTEAGARLLGPNVSGFLDLVGGVSLFGLPRPANLMAGGVGLVMQSGGLATHALSLCAQWGIGVSRLVTTGNEACVTASDVLADLAVHPETKAIAVFLESVRDPDVFRAATRLALEHGKPVVALQAGRSELGRSSALAHTGALVGDHAAAEAALAGLGVVCVESLEDLVATAGLLAHLPGGLPGGRVGVVAASGGACELIADHGSGLGLTYPALPERAVKELDELLPAGGAAKNPLDVTGFVVKAGDLVFDALQVFCGVSPEHYDALVFQSVTFPASDQVGDPAVQARFDALRSAQQAAPVPVLLQTAATYALTPAQAELLASRGLFVLPGISLGLRAVAAAERYHRLVQRHRRGTDLPLRAPGRAGRGDLDRAVASAGLRMPPRRLTSSPEDAAAAAASLGFPVVLKVVSPDIAHKTDVGGVELGLRSAEEVDRAARRMAAVVSERAPGARIEGFEVVASRSGGVELLVSVVDDPTWGPVLTLGAGGVLTEVLADVAVRSLPVDGDEVAAMLAELRLSRLLAGFRGREGADTDAVVGAVLAVARLFEQLAGARAVEVNPLWVRGADAEALDLLVDWGP